MKNLTPTKIEKMIYVIRDQRVMLDSDLAELYGVEVRSLNQAVKRNLNRFPDDFMFQISSEEKDDLSSKFSTFKKSLSSRKYLPYVFTENGVAMLSSVLKSDQAVQVNISIMRIFTRLRSFLLLEQNLSERMDELELQTSQAFRVVFEKLDDLEKATPTLKPQRKKIGLTQKKD